MSNAKAQMSKFLDFGFDLKFGFCHLDLFIIMIGLDKITTKGKAIYLAYDHGIEHGPIDLKGRSIDPAYILDLSLIHI